MLIIIVSLTPVYIGKKSKYIKIAYMRIHKKI
jgi:hypothetical protein